MELEHSLNAGEALVHGTVRTPGVMHVNGIDLAAEWELVQEIGELLYS
jgi:hypothetical protein